MWTNSDAPIAEWLGGILGITVPDSAIRSVLIKRSVSGDTPCNAVTQRDAELLKADLYMWYYTTPSTTQSVEDSDSYWKHREGSSSSTPKDKDVILKMANLIYEKYGEDVVIQRSRIRVYNV